MKAIIVGCGKVGSALAATLVNDGHSVAVIDTNQKALDQVSEEIDFLPLCGNGGDINILREAGIETADIFIAVSPYDELNLLSCLVAQKVADVHTIARVRNPLYSKETEFLGQKLGISKIINPEYLAAKEIFKLMQYPAVSRLDSLADGSITLFSIHIKPEYKLAGRSLQEIRGEGRAVVLACAVGRKDDVIIPRGDFVIEAGDDVSFLATHSEMQRFLLENGIQSKQVDNCLITGGGTIGYYLTERLLNHKKNVRIIEKNEKRCELLSEAFPKAEIVTGDGTDRKFLIKQGLERADAFVSLTGIDEENIIVCTYAKSLANIKTITKVNRTDLREVMSELDIDSVVYPKLICADIIAQYVRAMNAGAGGNIETLYRYLDNRIEIVEFRAAEGSLVRDIPLYKLKLRPDLLVACIRRGNQIILPNGSTAIQADDSVIIVAKEGGITSLDKILA